jgi:dolichol-phosphate mannosyltransferase
LPEKDRFIRGLRAWVGFKQTGVDYVRPERFSGSGTSTNSFLKGLKWARKAIFSFSYEPLEWVFLLAGISVIVSLLAILIYILLFFLIPNAPKGFITILLAVLFLGSVQLVVLAIICEYIRRIFEEVKSRPISIVQKITKKGKRNVK